jgi:hypothetical protein
MLNRALRGLALLLCFALGPEYRRRSLDGGVPLDLGRDDGGIMAASRCWRREKGGWHYSIGHCEDMTDRTTIDGVWVTAFEERSFFPGLRERPDPRDPRRYAVEIELDEEAVFSGVAGRERSPHGEAVYIRFAGRRTRDPVAVDCYGAPYFVFVVDRLIEARYLGPVEPLPPGWWEQLARSPPDATVRRIHGGRWGALEAEAIERCRARADRLDD